MSGYRTVSLVGEAVRRHRLAAGLTQQELAGRAGVSIRGLRDLEQGRIRQPRAKSIRRLADALGLSAGERETLIGMVPSARAGSRQLRLGVLGPLTVSYGGQPLEMVSGRKRTLLGLLALYRCHAVPTSEIIDVLWDDRPPRTARNLVQVNVAELRGLLGPAGRILRSTSGGYALEVTDRELDLAEFEDLAARAETSRSADRLELFDRALQCWRGPILADVEVRLRQHPAATAAWHRKIAATVAFADAAVALKDSKRVVPPLRTLSREEPLNEAVHGRLMLALACAGEPATALQVFAELRARLADELGVEPSPEVRAIHHRILSGQVPDAGHRGGHRQDPSPSQLVRSAPGVPMTDANAPTVDGRSTVVARSRRRIVPAQLPAATTTFTGRGAELRVLDQLAAKARSSAVVIAAVAGTAGVGKTALALHWAHRAAAQFPDGQLYVNLRGFDPGGSVVRPAEALRRFLDALDIPLRRVPDSLEAQAALYRSMLVGRRVLVVLDNARDADQVRPLLPGSPGSLVLITSRNQMAGLVAVEGAYTLGLSLLSIAEARQLLTNRLGGDRVIAEPIAVADIISSCARLPLALAVVAARAAAQPKFPLATLASQLRATGSGLDTFADPDASIDLRTVFSYSYNALSEAAAQLFRLLGLHPGPDISVPAAASLAGIPVQEVRMRLAELTRAHLIDEHTPGRYTFHDLLRAYTSELAHSLDPDDERRSALLRGFDHYLHTAHTAANLLACARKPLKLTAPQAGVTPEQIASHDGATAWLAAEHPVLIAVVRHTADAGFTTHTWQLAWTMTLYLEWCARWHELQYCQRLALKAARRSNDLDGQAHAHSGLGRAYYLLGRPEEAYTQLRMALDLFSEVGDASWQADTHIGLASVCEGQGNHRLAIAHAEQSLEVHRATHHLNGQAVALNTAGYNHALAGDYEQALSMCDQALAILRPLGRRHAEGTAWDSLGYARHHLGHYQQATACYQRAVDLYRATGDHYKQARTLTKLAGTHHAAGDPHAAQNALRTAMAILDELHHPDAEKVRAKLKQLVPTSPPQDR